MKKIQLYSVLGMMICFVFAFKIYLSFNQHNQRYFEIYLKKALEEEAFAKQLKETEKEKKFESLLKGLDSLNIARYLNPMDSQGRQKKIEISQTLIKLAVEFENYQFAQYLAKELHSLSPEMGKTLITQIEVTRTQTLRQHAQRLSYWKQVLKDPEPGMRDEALLEISKMEEPEIFEELMALVQEGNHYYLKSPERRAQQDEYYCFIVQALGSLENPKTGEFLWNALDEMAKKVLRFKEGNRPHADVNYMVALAEALKDSKAPNYSEKFLKLVNQFGSNSLFGARTKLITKTLLQRDNLSTRAQPTSSKEYLLQASNKTEMNDFEGALLDYNEAIRLNPQEDEAYTKRGILKLNKEDLEGAINDFIEAIRLNPRHFEGYLQRGNAKMKKKDFEGALLDYNDAILRNPQASSAYKNRGWLKQQQGDFNGALPDYLEAIRSNPQDHEAYLYRGILKSDKEDFDSAIADFNEAIRLNPQSAKAYLNRGMMKYNKKDFEGAIADFTETLRLNPQEATAYFNRMMAHYENNSYASAKADLEEFERCASPDHPQYFQIPLMKESLEKIKPH